MTTAIIKGEHTTTNIQLMFRTRITEDLSRQNDKMKTAVVTLVVILMLVKNGLPYNVPVVHEVDHSIIHHHMMEDLAELLDYKMDSSDAKSQDAEYKSKKDEMMEDISRLLKDVNLDIADDEESRDPMYKWPKPKPGQIISKCSYYKYGCCADGRTEAPAARKEGCGIKICTDEKVLDCEIYKKEGRLQCGRYGIHYSKCAYTCRSPCKAAAPPKMVRCLARLNPWGCCWNGDPAFGPGKMGCKVCRDKMPHVCGQFKHISGGCNSGSYGIRTFMQKYCLKTCRKCHVYFYQK